MLSKTGKVAGFFTGAALVYLTFYAIAIAVIAVIGSFVLIVGSATAVAVALFAVVVGFFRLATKPDPGVVTQFNNFLKMFGVGLLLSPFMAILCTLIFVDPDPEVTGYLRLLVSLILSIPVILGLYASPLVFIVVLAVVLSGKVKPLNSNCSIYEQIKIYPWPLIAGIFLPVSVIVYGNAFF